MPKETKTHHHNVNSGSGSPRNLQFVWEPYHTNSRSHNVNLGSPTNLPTPPLLFNSFSSPNNTSNSHSPTSSVEACNNNLITTNDNTNVIMNNGMNINRDQQTVEQKPIMMNNLSTSLASPSGSFNSSFHIACTACREKHIKCDKKLPSCTYCIKHGLRCVYRKPKKRGRPSTKNKNGTPTEGETYENDPNEMVLVMGNNTGAQNSILVNPTNSSTSTSALMPLLQTSDNQSINASTPLWFPMMGQDTTTQALSSSSIPPTKILKEGDDMDEDEKMKHDTKTNGTINSEVQGSTSTMLRPTSEELANYTNLPHIDFNNESLVALIKMSRDLNRQLMKRLTVDDYYKSTSMPLVDQRSVEQLFFSDRRNTEANCLLYSIHMLMCQRKGYKEEAERAFEKTRALLSTVFDQWRSFLIACTYCNLSIYCSGEGNDADAVFYLSFVDYYFTQLKEKYNMNQQNLKYLKSIAEMAAGVGVGNEKPIGDELVSALTTSGINKQCQHDVANLLVGFYKYTTGQKKVPPELLQITSQNINQDTVYLYLTLFDMISKLVTTHESNRQRNMTPEQESISQAICDAFINGTRVLILQQCGYKGKVLEDAANRIAEIFSNEISIGFASPLYISAVAASCMVHLGIITEIENGERLNYENNVDYYSMIDKDLKAMNSLEKQFGRVRKRYSQIIQQLENIKQRRELEVSRLVFNEIERLKNARKQGNEGGVEDSLLSQEHISSIFNFYQQNGTEDLLPDYTQDTNGQTINGNNLSFLLNNPTVEQNTQPSQEFRNLLSMTMNEQSSNQQPQQQQPRNGDEEFQLTDDGFDDILKNL
ncbi:hypothetical protein ABK040_000079 [Willaertia magna]